MDDPPGIVGGVLLDILIKGILRARSAGWAGDAASAAREADHIHNLPILLRHFSTEMLSSYMKVEVLSYSQRCARSGISVADFEPLWQTLHHALNMLTSPRE